MEICGFSDGRIALYLYGKFLIGNENLSMLWFKCYLGKCNDNYLYVNCIYY